jgi:hypothetical protein
MRRIKPEVDIVLDILHAVVQAYPENFFAQSILYQYQERGGLSKKQLQGLYGKAQKVEGIPINKLATLEAIILRKHEKTKSDLPVATPLYNKDEEVGAMIDEILLKYPLHKRALFIKSKYDNNEVLTSTEISDLKAFVKLVNSSKK